MIAWMIVCFWEWRGTVTGLVVGTVIGTLFGRVL